jgi:hypothetical protein
VIGKIDPFLDGELTGQQADVLLAHISACPECASELAVRRDLRLRLRTAVRSVGATPAVQNRIRVELARAQKRPAWIQRQSRFALAAAAVLIAVFGGVAYQLNHLRSAAESEQTVIARLTSRVAAVFRPGLGDHIHCAVYGKVPKAAPAVAELAETIGRENEGLLKVAIANAPPGYNIMLAHTCRHRGRRFVHVVLKSDNHLASLVVVRKQAGESLRGLRQTPAGNGGAYVRTSAGAYRIAAFETEQHIAYVISDLESHDNGALMAAMLPGVRAHLRDAEA